MRRTGLILVWLIMLAAPAAWVRAAAAQRPAPSSDTNAAKMEKILFVVTSHDSLGNTGRETGFTLSEVTQPHKVLTDSGYIIEFVSPRGGRAPMDDVELDDPVSKAFLENPAYREQIENTLSPDRVNPREYVAIYYAGGHGTMWDFPKNERLAAIATAIYERGGVVAAVCHGPAGLLPIKLSDGTSLVSGRKLTSFTNEEEEAVGLTSEMPFLLETVLVKRGAIHTEATTFQPHVVVDGRLVTGQNPASAAGVAYEMIKLLKERHEHSNQRTTR